ncbi:MAG: PD40 domain-containing protein [Fimbriimonadaceae bacterium]|nr:PD40 domain-containing protein [Fimbriimonadaceae bacterium]
MLPRTALLTLWLALAPGLATPDLAFVRDENLWLHRFEPAQDLQLTKAGGYGTPSWTPDGKALVFVRNGRNIERFDVDSRQLTTIVAGLGPVEQGVEGCSAAAVHPGGTAIWFSRVRRLRVQGEEVWDNAIWRVGLDGSGLRKILQVQGISPRSETMNALVERIVWSGDARVATIGVQPHHGWGVGRGVYLTCCDVNGVEREAVVPLAYQECNPVVASTPVRRGDVLAWPVTPMDPAERPELFLDLLAPGHRRLRRITQPAEIRDNQEQLVWPDLWLGGKLVAAAWTGREQPTVRIWNYASGELAGEIANADTPLWRPSRG